MCEYYSYLFKATVTIITKATIIIDYRDVCLCIHTYTNTKCAHAIDTYSRRHRTVKHQAIARVELYIALRGE